jgi:hypothetical protein
MDKDLPLYDITLEDFEQGMYKISLVDKPAIEENFIYFSKQSIEMFANKSKDYGFDLPNGTVFVKAKIESDELFNAIKDGEINGFSIEIAANITPTNKEEMTEFSFAKELGKLEAQFEAMTNKFQERIEVLESENEILLSSLTSFEEKFMGVEDLKTAIEMIQKHIESMGEMAQEEEEEMKEDEKYEATEEVVEETVEEEFTATEEVAEVEENFEAEEEVNEQEVEEQFTAQQTEEVVVEVEDKTIKFERITSDKVNLINKHFPSLY